MKKVMMTAVAVVLAAGMVSAANFNWNINANWGVLPNGSSWTTGVNDTTPFFYAIILADDLLAATTAIETSGFVINTSGGGESGVFLDWGVTTNLRGASATVSSPNIATSSKIQTTDQDYIAIAFAQGAGGVWHYWASGVLEDKKGYATNPDLGMAGTWTASIWAAGSGWEAIPGAIPEPTAMALLALGAAAVGLRRRFRK